ncbi:hypothetical protein N7478_008128 [Penicillium angulare]|uniref:uncharacterized protein n=1 Tax=Penicillium angulare TaxID=116970 RepID=UPI00254268C3|nr:uncharacterized protein N7478_008128 [Penicillium angulare]KAJ5273003.1 hypothetical protein N7478_008128 [Penicillium angulare]
MADSDKGPEFEQTVKILCDDVDFYNFILEDQQTSAPDDHDAISETRDHIKRLQAEIGKLLGNVALNSPQPSAPATPQRLPQQPTATPPVLTREPQSMPSHTPNRIGDPSSTPGTYWPSSAPSPFLNHPNAPIQPYYAPHGHPMLPHPSGQAYYPGPSSSKNRLPAFSANGSRKRTREDSNNLQNPRQPSKKATINSSQRRVEELEVKLDMQLEENRRTYAIMRDPEEVKKSARLEGLSEEQVLLDIAEEEAENAKCIRTFIQAEKDEEYARIIQAQDDEYTESYPSTHPSFNIPDRTHYPHPVVKQEPYLNPKTDYRNPNPIYLDSDDDIEEITPDTFFSGGRGSLPWPSQSIPNKGGLYPSQPLLPMPGSFPGMPPSMGMTNPHMGWNPMKLGPPAPSSLPYPSQLLGSTPSRRLPWMPGQQHPEMKAFDLVREQQDMEEDTIDFEAYKESDFPDDIKNLLTGIKNINDATKANNDEKPQALKVTLMKHQTIGLAWLKAKEESNHKGGILADDMGLGKTIQTIALMIARPPTDPDRHPSLIVAPKALMEQWRLEIGRHVNPGHKLSVFIYHGLGGRHIPWRDLKKNDVIITTFGTLTANYKYIDQSEKLQEEGKDASIVRHVREKAVLFSPAAKWYRVIIDEAQNIKNPAAKSARACCRLDATYRWCLTGTPMMNRLEDFQSLLAFLRIRPYNNKEKFKRDFVKPIKAQWGDDHIMKQLRVLVKSVCLRRTKKTKIDGQPILQLPPKVIEKIHVVFNEEEKAVYDELSSDTQRVITRYLDNGTLGKNYSHVLVLLLRLRQCCDHPLLIRGFNNDGSTTVQGVDLVANAKLLSAATVERIKSNTDDDDGACPICMDSIENAVIYIPCGHSLCSECFARISDPTMLARQDSDAPGMIKCQNCRGPVDPLKVTDSTSFKKAHDPADSTEEGSDESAQQTEDSGSEAYDTDSDSATEPDGSDKKPKKKSLADLRAAGLRNKAEKKKYLRRLEKMWTPSAKIDKCIEILEANEARGAGEKTIVFSQFTSLLDLLEIPMNRRGWAYVRFDGTMNIHDRNASVAAFTDDPDCKVMIVSLKAGNAGLNLVAASHVILFDPFWNPYVEDQAIDRAHRIGQTKDVFVHRLLIEGTVEDRIVELQEKKRELIGGALDEGGTMNVSRLDTRELAYLFGVTA